MDTRVHYMILEPNGLQTTLLTLALAEKLDAEAVVFEGPAARAQPATFAIIWVDRELKRSQRKYCRRRPNSLYRIAYAPEHLENAGGPLVVPESARLAIAIFVRSLSPIELSTRKQEFQKAVDHMHRRCISVARRQIVSCFVPQSLAA